MNDYSSREFQFRYEIADFGNPGFVFPSLHFQCRLGLAALHLPCFISPIRLLLQALFSVCWNMGESLTKKFPQRSTWISRSPVPVVSFFMEHFVNIFFYFYFFPIIILFPWNLGFDFVTIVFYRNANPSTLVLRTFCNLLLQRTTLMKDCLISSW